MGVSKLGSMDLIFIDARVKINGTSWGASDLKANACDAWEVFEICGEFFIFQQGNVATYWARETINLQQRDTCVHFIRTFASQQQRSELGWLQKTGRNTAVGLASSWRWWTEAALDRCLASFRIIKRHRWRSWEVA